MPTGTSVELVVAAEAQQGLAIRGTVITPGPKGQTRGYSDLCFNPLTSHWCVLVLLLVLTQTQRSREPGDLVREGLPLGNRAGKTKELGDKLSVLFFFFYTFLRKLKVVSLRICSDSWAVGIRNSLRFFPKKERKITCSSQEAMMKPQGLPFEGQPLPSSAPWGKGRGRGGN